MDTSGSAKGPALTGGSVVVAALKAAGVDTVYGVPGGQTLAVLDAIYDDDAISFVAMRHEMAAAHAAEARFRVTGMPGVCLVTTGPGATHALSAIGGALRDRTAMLIVTCNNRREHLDEEDAQAADHRALLTPLTKWSAQVLDPKSLARTLRIAFVTALSGVPGPVHVDIPRDILEAAVPAGVENGVAAPVVPPRLAPSPTALDDAARLLEHAERPVFWAGNGVALSGASATLLALAERLRAPVLTTFSGIGVVPSSHPLVFGPRTRHGSAVSHAILEQADVVFAIGMRLSSSSTHRWAASLPANLIHSDVDASALGRHYPTAVMLPGDAHLVLDGITCRLNAPAPSRAEWLESLTKEHQAWQEHLQAIPDEDAEQRVHPIALMRLLNEVRPDGVIYCVDAGNPGIWSHLLKVERPRSYMKPVNFGQMGFALPAAIAAKHARPDCPVTVLVGDGSLGMTVAELETAVRERLAITVVVLNDSAYNNIRQEQLAIIGQPRYIGVDFGDVDFAAVARGFGAWGERARGVAAVRAAFQRAAEQRDRPAVIDVILDPLPNVWTKPF